MNPGNGTWPDQQTFLATLARGIGAKTIVESGTYLGGTTKVLAEHNPEADVWTSDIVDHKVKLPANCHFYCMDFAQMIELFVPTIDFAYIDASGATNRETWLRKEHGELVLDRLTPGGIIAWDDTWSEWEGVDWIRDLCQINLRVWKGLSLYQSER